MDGRAHRRLDAVPLPLHGLALVTLIVLAGAALRVPFLARDARFGVDEALYATFARRVALHGDWLLSGTALDKPPLLFFSIAGSFKLFGATEFAARLPNLAASLVSIALVYALARRLYDRRVAYVAALLLALSPLDQALAATAFTDPLLTLFILATCLAAVRKQWGWAGAGLALAFATKPSALQWLPLVLLLGVAVQGSWRGLLRLLIPFGAGLSALTLWSIARDTHPDFWTLNLFNNNPGRLIRANELLPRFMRWGNLLGSVALFPLPLIGWLAAPLTLLLALSAPRKRLIIDLILTAYCIASLALLWLVAFNTYDRYLHTLVPFCCMLLARVLLLLCERLTRRYANRCVLGTTLCAVCLYGVLGSGAEVGGAQGQYRQIDQIAAALNRLPAGSIIYDHWLGWELGFYLGDQPAVELIWLPTMDALAASSRRQPVYFVAPRAQGQVWLERVAAQHLRVTILYTAGSFLIAQVTPPINF